MKSSVVRRLVTTALLAALTFVATVFFRVPSPLNGYINLGDGVVLLAGCLLSPTYGFLAAGIGSALADLLAGYVQYMPGTLFIKAAVALVAWVLFHVVRGLLPGKLSVVARVLACVAGEGVMVLGYLLYEAFLLGYGAGALAAVVGNLMQGVVGVVGCVLLAEVFERNRFMKKWMRED